MLTLDDAKALAEGKWRDWLLGVAGAYAMHSVAADPGHPAASRVGSPDETATGPMRPGLVSSLSMTLTNLRMLTKQSPVPDIGILEIGFAQARRGNVWNGRLPEAYIPRLTVWAERGAVPLLRWGVPLAIRLLDLEHGVEALARWRQALQRVERRLSPISVWTAWTE